MCVSEGLGGFHNSQPSRFKNVTPIPSLLPQHNQPFRSGSRTYLESVFSAFWTARTP